MGDIFGFKVSSGDLVVALVLAIVAERLVKLTPKFVAAALDYAARWSDYSRASRVLKLENLVSELERDLTDQHRQSVKMGWNISGMIAEATAVLVNIVFASAAFIVGEIMRVETALHVGNDSLGLFADSSRFPYFLLTITGFATAFLALYHFSKLAQRLASMRRIRYPTRELRKLRERIERLQRHRRNVPPSTS